MALSGRGDILTLLTGAYSVYTPGVIFPLLISILCYKKKKLNKALWISGVIVGGVCGLAGTYYGNTLISVGIPAILITNLSLIGMGLSLIFSCLSIKNE